MGYVALLFCAVFTVWLLREYTAKRGPMSRALWVPVLWLLMYSSRPLSEWLHMGGGGSEAAGSPVDASVQLVLIVAAFIILTRRRFQWGTLPAFNAAFSILFLYWIFSITWAPYPFIAFKRLFKEFGDVLIVMVVLTEVDPAAAFKTVCIRCATIWFPLSVVLIRWFPHYGRAYSMGGFEMITGVTTQKNSLGEICAVFGLVLLWDLLDISQSKRLGQLWKYCKSEIIVLGIGLWLLFDSHSMTSLLAFLAGTVAFFSPQLRLVRGAAPFFAKCLFICIGAGLVIASVWTMSVAPLLESIGRNPTFTDRTQIWQAVLARDSNPLVGCGFFSFWLVNGAAVSQALNVPVPNAHCGYLGMYLDGGIAGCALLGIFLIFTCWRLANHISYDNTFSRALFALALMALIVNFSETCFFRLCAVWIALVLSALGSHPLILQKAVPEAIDLSDRNVEPAGGIAV